MDVSLIPEIPVDGNFLSRSNHLRMLTEKWKHLKRLCLPVRFTPLEIPVLMTPKSEGIISNGVNGFFYCALGSAFASQAEGKDQV